MARKNIVMTKLQVNIMRFIDFWVRTERTPVPQKEIINKMSEEGVSNFTTLLAVKTLSKKGYIRRSVNRSAEYVMLSTI